MSNESKTQCLKYPRIPCPIEGFIAKLNQISADIQLIDVAKLSSSEAELRKINTDIDSIKNRIDHLVSLYED